MSDRKISSIRQVAGDLVAVGRSWAIEVESPEYTVSDADVLDAIVQRNYSKRFIYYEEHPDAALYNMWKRTLRTLDAQIRALAIQATANYDPLGDYSRVREYEESAESTRETTYGKKDTRAGSSSNTTTYNSTITGDIVTYDDTLRDQTKTTRGGTDGDSSTSSSTSTLSGKDTQEEGGERTITETVTGNNHNKSENLKAYLDLMLRDDLLDYVLGEFERRYLYYGGD